MSPRKNLEELNHVQRTLGEAGFKGLSDQLDDIQSHVFDMFEDPHISSRVASVPAAVAAAVILRELQRYHPRNLISGWTTENQLKAVYAILAFREGNFFADVFINFASDLQIEHLVRDFEEGRVS